MLPFFFLVLLLSFAPHYVPLTTAVSTHNRRVLHESFFPIDTPPPTQPLIPSPPPPIQYPFQPSTPDNNNNNNNDPFFPTDPSPPPPLSPSSFVSFPANISSIILPKNSKSKPISLKLIAITITSVLAAIIVLSIAIFLHFKKRHPLDSKTQTSDNNSNGNNQNTVNNSTIPKLQRPSQTSSEFLYLGTIVSSHGNIDTQHNSNNQSTVPTPRKIDSPELRPLPPLNGRNNLRRSYGSPVNKASRVYAGFREGPQNSVENNEDFYSTEDSIGGGSLSRRDFGTVEVEKFVESSSGSTNSDSSLSSCTGSPNRSVSLSISPPVSLSPKRERESLRPKSPELVAVETTQPPQYPPPPPPPPAFRPSFVESVSPSPVSSLSPERYSSRSIDSSPRISNVWDQNLEFPVRISSHLQQNRPVFVPPPPHPPPPPPPPPPAVLVTPLRPNAFKSPIELSSSNLEHSKKNDQNVESQSIEKHDEINEEIQKPKLKTLHWDKVRASSDREMVWDQLKSSSFKLNEEMIETLFVAKASNLNTNETARKNPGFSSLSQENRVLDPKKSQNIAILLRALNVTTEEVCEALLEGNAETLGSELLESLLKMAPSKEEERKLKEYKDDSPFKLGPAEKFLKALVDIPFAFKRVDAMLYISNFDSEVDYLRKSFETLEVACEELRSSRMFLKLLEAVLKTGNHMNVGTNRGDAHAFKLDTLLKLVDVKGADGKTTLLHFVVQEIIKREGSRLSYGNQNQEFTIDDDTKCRKLGLQVVSNIGSELINVKNAATMDSEVLHSDLLKLSEGMGNITEVVRSIEAIRLEESSTKRFSNSMNKFMRVAEEKIIRLQAQETVAMSLVKEITEYFHGDSSREEARPLRIFMVVKDFLMILDRVCKEVGLINERSIISSAHKLPVPVNPNLQPVVTGFSAKRQHSFSDEESSSP